MICTNCGREAPTALVSFHQTIGMLFARSEKEINGKLCKDCIHRCFWHFTVKTLCLGWWAPFSLVLTPFYVLGNILTYCTSLWFSPVPPDAKRSELSEDDVARLQVQTQRVIDAINDGKPVHEVAENLATQEGVSSGQAILFIRLICKLAESSGVDGYPKWNDAEFTAIPCNPDTGEPDSALRDFRVLGIPLSFRRRR